MLMLLCWWLPSVLLLWSTAAAGATFFEQHFPTADIRNGGEFNGFVIEGVVSF